MAKKEIIYISLFGEGDAERGGEHIVPQITLDDDGRLFAVRIIQRAQIIECPIEPRAWPEPILHLFLGRDDVAPFDRLRFIAQPFV